MSGCATDRISVSDDTEQYGNSYSLIKYRTCHYTTGRLSTGHTFVWLVTHWKRAVPNALVTYHLILISGSWPGFVNKNRSSIEAGEKNKLLIELEP